MNDVRDAEISRLKADLAAAQRVKEAAKEWLRYDYDACADEESFAAQQIAAILRGEGPDNG